MAQGKRTGTGIAPFVLFALAGLAGTAASLYAMVIAYLAGSTAQASIDGTAPADPIALARASMSELAGSVGAAPESGVINVDEDDVHVRDAQGAPLELVQGEVVDG